MLQMANHFFRGPRTMMVKVEGRSVTMHYGTQKVWELVPMYGEEILKIPEECVSMHNFQKEILHMEDSWVRSAEWPFLALSTASQVAVDPLKSQNRRGSCQSWFLWYHWVSSLPR